MGPPAAPTMPPATPGTPTLGATPGLNPFQAMMMQQMMNPNMGFGGMGSMGGAGGMGGMGTPPPAEGTPMAAAMEAANRARYAQQLSQLANMGFTDEAVCLRALVQHNGRLDSAIDSLLSGPTGN